MGGACACAAACGLAVESRVISSLIRDGCKTAEKRRQQGGEQAQAGRHRRRQVPPAQIQATVVADCPCRRRRCRPLDWPLP